MKHLIKFVILGCMLTVLLSVLSLQKAEAKIPLSGAACSGCEELAGVAAVSSKDIWAVGGHYDSSSGQILSLIENWNGTSWSVVPSPNAGSVENSLFGVAAISSTDVWAVGSYFNYSGTGGALIENWNGTSWSVVASPNPGTCGGLSGVTAISSTDVWAVGTTATCGSVNKTLIEHWNGTRWSVVTSPNPGSGGSLSGVVAVSSINVWAVGTYYNKSNTERTLIEHWNGTSWSVVKSPNVWLSTNYLSGVTAVSATDVWAGGTYDNSSGQELTLIENWNGTSWSVVPSPNVGSGENDLYSVEATSATNVRAVGGRYYNSKQPFLTLTERWNGTKWSVVKSPN